MKKLISLIIALVMLLSVCAMAEGKEISIGNFVYSDNAGNSLDLTGIELKFAAAENNGKAGASAAIAANGEDVVRAVVSADEGGIYLSADGISDVYSLPMETIEMMASDYVGQLSAVQDNAEQILAAIEEMALGAAEIVSSSLTPAGTQTVSGVEYEAYNINITAEQTKEIVALLDKLVALYPEVLAETGYDSIADMFEAEGVEISYVGDVLINDTEMMYDIYVCEQDEPVVNIYVSLEDTYDAEEDLNCFDIYAALYDPAIEDLDESEMGYVLFSIYTDPVTEEFVMADMSIGDGEGEGDILAVLDLGRTEEDNKCFIIKSMDDSWKFDVSTSTMGSISFVNVNFMEATTGVTANVVYAMLEGGKNVLQAMLSDGVDEFNLSADINISDTDGAWLPVIGETVDIMSIDENQMNKLSLEAMGIVGKLISACSAASEDFAALVSAMM